ncbi:MAG: ribonuclease H-like domain-containing protein [Eubacteriales bacterium]|nr:ribonuclease H-like domain-containing protein [Eubacteriales bacterium]
MIDKIIPFAEISAEIKNNFLADFKQIEIFQKHIGESGTPVFYDVETTGLSPKESYLYLIGMLYEKDGYYVLHQMFAETIDEEAELVRDFSKFISELHNHYLVHYNGNQFDRPYVEYKCEQYHVPSPFTDHNTVDLYQLYKPCKKLFHLKSMRLAAMEQFLNPDMQRKYPNGKECISYYQKVSAIKGLELKYHIHHEDEYQTYIDTLLGHNREDLMGTMLICSLSAYFQWDADCLNEGNLIQCQILDKESSSPKYQITYQSNRNFSVSLNLEYQNIHLLIENEMIILTLPIYENQIRLYHRNYKDYVYLTNEDYAIPKSLSSFMESSLYEKASEVNCYTWLKITTQLLENNEQPKQLLLHYLKYFFN